jgi:hypothetical protein
VQDIMIHYDAYDKRKRLEAADYLQKLFLGTVSSRNEITALFLFDNEKLLQKYSLASISIRGGFSVERDAWFLENLQSIPLLPNGTRLLSGQPDSFLIIPTLSSSFENAYFIVLRELNSFSPFQRIGYMMSRHAWPRLNKIATNTIDPSDLRAVRPAGKSAVESGGTVLYQKLSDASPAFGVSPGHRWSCPSTGRTAWRCREPRPSAGSRSPCTSRAR